MGFYQHKIGKAIAHWLNQEVYAYPSPALSNFERMKQELHIGDVLLVEGRTRISHVINLLTLSPWTHSALYIGRIYDIQDPKLREIVYKHYQGAPEEQLLIESLLGKGVIVTPLSRYKDYHVRICRPKGINFRHAQAVIAYVIGNLGVQYNIRQIFDLARFLLPWSILPRRWRSSIFSYHAGSQTRLTCSLLIANAFASIRFPILPYIRESNEHGLEFIHRNPQLFTPSDFDYSPYFDIIKYPLTDLPNAAPFEHLPWAND